MEVKGDLGVAVKGVALLCHCLWSPFPFVYKCLVIPLGTPCKPKCQVSRVTVVWPSGPGHFCRVTARVSVAADSWCVVTDLSIL